MTSLGCRMKARAIIDSWDLHRSRFLRDGHKSLKQIIAPTLYFNFSSLIRADVLMKNQPITYCIYVVIVR